MTRTTRRVCASFYYSSYAFRAVLDLLLVDRHRYIPQSDDLDTGLVLAHAEAGARERMRHHLIVLAMAFAGTLLTGLIARSMLTFLLLAAILLPTLFVLRFMMSLVIGTFQGGISWGRLAVLVLFAWLLIPAILVLSISLVSVAVPLLFGFGMSFVQVWRIHREKLREFSPSEWTGTAPPPYDHQVRAAVDDLAADVHGGNATVYTGFDPFIGGGYKVHNWERAIKLVPHEDSEREVVPLNQINEYELVSRMHPSIQAFGADRLLVRRRYFVHGEQAAELPGMITDPYSRPTGRIDLRHLRPEQVDGEVARWYLWLTSVRWEGELVLNTFFRVKIMDTVVFVEMVHLVVGPLLPQFVKADLDYSQPSLSQLLHFAGMAARRLWDLPSDLLWWVTRFRRWGRGRREIDRLRRIGLSPDYGARLSVREFFAGKYYDHYFQLMDAVEHAKSLDLQMFLSLDDALEGYGYQIAMRDQMVQNITSLSIEGGVNVTGGQANFAGGSQSGFSSSATSGET